MNKIIECSQCEKPAEYSVQATEEADTSLKALLKLTIALSEAGELK